MRKIFVSICCIFIVANCSAQTDRYNKIDLHPVSPTAFQFLKYTEMPVSEYTGVPDISVPLYEINVDEIKIPVQLTYHAQGIRVSDEASWVGLGWDLQIGSIVQSINDRDDYGADPIFGPYVKRLPDYFPANGDGSPRVIPTRYQFPWLLDGTDWYTPYPVSSPEARQGYALANDYYVPVNGEFSVQQGDLFTSRAYDSEPDLFTANFLGHSLKFIRDFSSGNFIIVLNKKTYRVEKTTNGFCITSPGGSKYFFELKSEIESFGFSESIDVEGQLPNGLGYETTSAIYFLTQIVTAKGKTITFQYETTNLTEEYPAYSDKFQAATNAVYNTMHVPPVGINYVDVNIGQDPQPNGIFKTFSTNREHYVYLKSITFPGGKVDFQISDRSDITSGKKLDLIQLKDANMSVVKAWQLDYAYFDASSINGNGYDYSSGTPLTQELRSSLRLKLLGIKEVNGGTYSFFYNSISLPKKNSFAKDYWGYYNGKLTNTSLAPNPGLFNLSAYANSNDKNSNLTYAKACILEKIQYPTGGRVNFEYELNEFAKDQVIGLPPSTPDIIQGCGLRVNSVIHTADLSTQSMKSTYTYDGGKLITPLQVYREVSYSELVPPYDNPVDFIGIRGYSLKQISANGVFSSNPLGSISGVGYTTVTKKEVDHNGVSKGKTVTEFVNNIDIFNPTIGSRTLFCDIPTVKSINEPENGSVKTISIFNDQDMPLAKTENNYIVKSSSIYYGARILPFKTRYSWPIFFGAPVQHIARQNLIGYYPIFDCETLVQSNISTTYANGTSLTTTKWNSYDNYNQLYYSSVSGSGAKDEVEIYYPYDFLSNPVFSQMYTSNRFSDIVSVKKYKSDIAGSTRHLTYTYAKTYTQINNGFLESNSSIVERNHPYNNLPTEISYDQYDDNSNLLQFTTKGITNSFIWDYSKQYLVAEVKNASLSSISYTSFEADGKGGWSFSGSITTDALSPTGRKNYNLSTGNISKSNLPAQTYIVSYWSKNGAKNVNGTSSISGRTLNGWMYYEHKVAVNANGTISVTGSGLIDELRLYPEAAVMTSYTYDLLIGMTTQCDENNRITYFEYDNNNRLSLVRDQDKNIARRICYNYAGQPEDCLPNLTPLWETTGLTRCQSCSSNSNYTSGIGEHQEKDNNPGSLTYNNYRWVSDGQNASCFPQEDWQNTTTLTRCKALSTIGEIEQEQKDVNPCSPSYNEIRWIVITTDLNACPSQNCNSSNCSGDDKKCIAGICETGTRIYKTSVRTGTKPNFIYNNTYVYRWSDCSESPEFSNTTTSPVTIGDLCLIN